MSVCLFSVRLWNKFYTLWTLFLWIPWTQSSWTPLNTGTFLTWVSERYWTFFSPRLVTVQSPACFRPSYPCVLLQTLSSHPSYRLLQFFQFTFCSLDISEWMNEGKNRSKWQRGQTCLLLTLWHSHSLSLSQPIRLSRNSRFSGGQSAHSRPGAVPVWGRGGHVQRQLSQHDWSRGRPGWRWVRWRGRCENTDDDFSSVFPWLILYPIFLVSSTLVFCCHTTPPRSQSR